MTPARWQAVEELFHSALEQEAGQMSAFLDRSCEGDALLRGDVETLVASHQRAGGFIETTAAGLAVKVVEDRQVELLIGRTLGHYKIERRIATGGMGDVYGATDLVAGRAAALKILPRRFTGDPGRLQRFRQEARAVVALNHPNILTVYEVGEAQSVHYIASELIEGETLRQRLVRGPIATAEALDIAIQVASALATAHSARIVHRDIKPENIMLRPDGYVKVLDFGIAKLAEQELPVPISEQEALLLVETNAGSVLGTACYMSPEQARGEPIDQRTDIWSLGVVLYEMLAGAQPFSGDTPIGVINSILTLAPAPLANSDPALQQIIAKSLRKTREDRYQTAEEFLAALKTIRRRIEFTDELKRSTAAPSSMRWMRSPTALVLASLAAALALLVAFMWRADRTSSSPPEKSIAVLPFESGSDDAENAFLAAGIHGDVLTSLAQIHELKVISRTSVMAYQKSQGRSLREISRELGVSNVLEGSVRRVADQLVINVALIDARNEQQIWSRRYERTLSDAASFQGELAVEIARALHVTLTPTEQTIATTKPTENADAYLLFLRGREAETKASHTYVLQPAIQLYQQAVDLDPTFALARARLSLVATDLAGWPGQERWAAKARDEAAEALRLRPDLAEAYLALAFCYLKPGGQQHGDGERALIEIRKAAKLSPNSSEVHLWEAFAYKQLNRYGDRLAALRRAEALDPRNGRVLFFVYLTTRWLRDWRGALYARDRWAIVRPPDASSLLPWDRAQVEFRLTGDVQVLHKAIAEQLNASPPRDLPWLSLARFETAMLERNYDDAERFLAAIPSQAFGTARATEFGIPEQAGAKVFHEALLAFARGSDAAATQQALEAARRDLEERLSAGNGTNSDDRLRANLGLVLAFLGRKEEAIHQARHAVEQRRGSAEKNAMFSALALIYAHTGEAEKALDLVEHLLTVPCELLGGAVYDMTLADLKWRWLWDPLRNHPRFEKILASPEPKTVTQ
ncbi:MAG: protein kinase [Chthoniobacterales bacterium]|nr:protein kinase [Chthoniobacterales bacterium]